MKIDIRISNLSNGRVQFKLNVSPNLRKYFLQNTSYVQYDCSIDLSNVSNSILAIPIVSAIAPIAWAVGADINVPELDATYQESMAKVKDIYREFYAKFSFRGDIQPLKIVTNRFGTKRTGMLFSSGVDSLTSYLRHKHEKPDLFSVYGFSDIPLSRERYWSRMRSDVNNLVNCDGVMAFQIKTDAFRNINHELLEKEFGVRWWGEVASGLFLLGMCAPVTVMREIGTVIIASSYTDSFRKASTFHPSIDNNISWAGVSVVHDGYEMSRQQKLNYLCRRENLGYLSHLRVCWDSTLTTNCGNCEKCLRTIAGLVIEGVDPNNCNFEIDEKTFARLKNCFAKGKLEARAGLLFMWSDIQKHIPERIDIDIMGSKGFLTWLRGFDLSKYRTSRLRHFLWSSHLKYSNQRITAEAIRRKIKCYCFIALAKLRLL